MENASGEDVGYYGGEEVGVGYYPDHGLEEEREVM